MKTLAICLLFASSLLLTITNTDPFNFKSAANDVIIGDSKFVYAASHSEIEGLAPSSYMVIQAYRPTGQDVDFKPLAKGLNEDLKQACINLREQGDIGAYSEFCVN